MSNNLACKWDSERTGERRRPVVFASSSVYDKEDTLRQIFDLLATNGYEPWMSFKGSLATASYRSAFGNCLHAVENADLFIGVISPWYGRTLLANATSQFNAESINPSLNANDDGRILFYATKRY